MEESRNDGKWQSGRRLSSTRRAGSYNDEVGSPSPAPPRARGSVVGLPPPADDDGGWRPSVNEDAPKRARVSRKHSTLQGSRREDEDGPSVPVRRGSMAAIVRTESSFGKSLEPLEEFQKKMVRRSVLQMTNSEPDYDAIAAARDAEEADSAVGGVHQSKTQRAARMSLLYDFLQAPEPENLEINDPVIPEASWMMTVKLGLRASNRVAGALRTTMPAVSLDTHHQSLAGAGESERGVVARSLKPLTLKDILHAADSGIPPLPSSAQYDPYEEPSSPITPGTARSTKWTSRNQHSFLSVHSSAANDTKGSIVALKGGDNSVRGGDANSGINGRSLGHMKPSRSLLASSQLPDRPPEVKVAPGVEGTVTPVAVAAVTSPMVVLGLLKKFTSIFKRNDLLGTASMDRGLGATKPALRKVSAYATTLDRRNEHTTRARRLARPRHVVFRNVHDATAEAKLTIYKAVMAFFMKNFASSTRLVQWSSYGTVLLMTWALFDVPYRLALAADNYSYMNWIMDFFFLVDTLMLFLVSLRNDLGEAFENGVKSIRFFPTSVADRETIRAFREQLASGGSSTAHEGSTSLKQKKKKRASASQKAAALLAGKVLAKKGPREKAQQWLAKRVYIYLSNTDLRNGRSLVVDLLNIVCYLVVFSAAQFVKPSRFVWWFAHVPRLSRVPELMRFFREKELDVHFDMSLIALFKFILLVYGAAHCLGCLFYALSVFQGERFDTTYQPFSILYSEFGTIEYNYQTSDRSLSYFICLFKGFNIITALSYESVYPETHVELVFSILCIYLQLVVYAYILGTITNYLVKKDVKTEMDRKQLVAVEDYCRQRSLPHTLTQKLVEYFQFQQRKKRVTDMQIVKVLPRNIRTKMCAFLYSDVLSRNAHLFTGVNAQFANQLLVRLREVHIMPGEVIIRQRDMSRELFFLTHGNLEVFRENGVILRTLRSDSDAPNVVGEFAFLMSLGQPYTVACWSKSDATCLQLSKLDFEDLLKQYPEAQDSILTNLLMEFGLNKNGADDGRARIQDDPDFMALRLEMQNSLFKRNAETLTAVTYAASEGDVDAVRALLKRGLPIDTGDYDMRTTLHLATVEGNLKVVECLVAEGADVNVKDRWGQTPMQESINNNHSHVTEFLAKHHAVLDYQNPADHLCTAASKGDVDRLKQLLDHGVSPDISDYDNRSALHLAASDGNLDVVVYLTTRKANINIVDRWGGTPLEDAIRAGHLLLARIISSRGGTLNPNRVHHLLQDAVHATAVERLKMLVTNGCDVNMVDYDGRSPLALAAAEGHILVVEYLIFAGANLNAVDRWGRTPLFDALKAKHFTSASLIKAAGGRLADGKELDPADTARLVEVHAMKRILALVKEKVFQSNQSALFSSEYRVNLVTDVHLASLATIGSIEVVQRLKEVAPGVVEFLQTEFKTDFSAARKAAININATCVGAAAAILRRIVWHKEKSDRKPADANDSTGASGKELITSLKQPRPEKDGKKGRGRRRKRVKQEERQAAVFHGVLLRFGHRDSPLGHVMWALQEVIERTVSRGGSGDDQLRAIFGHLGLPYVTDKTFREILEKVTDGKGVSLFRLLACDMFVKILEKDQEATHMVVEMGNEEQDTAGAEDFMDADDNSFLNGSFVSGGPMSTSRTAANVIKAILVMNELFAIFDRTGTGVVQTSELEAVAEEAGELGSALIEEMFTYIDQQEEEGIDFQGVDRVAFFSHFLHALGIVGDDAMEPADDMMSDEDGFDSGFDDLDEAATMNSWMGRSQTGGAGTGNARSNNIMSIGPQHSSNSTLPMSPRPGGNYHHSIGSAMTMGHGQSQLLLMDNYNRGGSQSATGGTTTQRFTAWFFSRPSVLWAKRMGSKIKAASKTAYSVVNIFVGGPPPWQDAFQALFFDVSVASGLDGSQIKVPADLDKLIAGLTDGRGMEKEDREFLLRVVLGRNWNRKSYGTSGGLPVNIALMQSAVQQLTQKSHHFASMLNVGGGAAAVLPPTAHWLVLHPQHPMRIHWDSVITFISIYLFFDVPFRIAFDPVHSWGMTYLITNQVIDAFLILDIIVKWFTAYFNVNSVLETDLGAIHRHYMGEEFKLDIVAAFPLDLVAWLSFAIGNNDPPFVFMAFLRLPKLLRMHRVKKKRSTVPQENDIYTTISSVVPDLVGILHLLACILWYIGRNGKENPVFNTAWFDFYKGMGSTELYGTDRIVDQYILSFYWVATTISTTSLVGDMIPQTPGEGIFSCIVMVANLTVFTFILGNISDAVMEQDEEKVEQRQRIMAVEQLIVGRKLPVDLASEIRKHFSYVVTTSNDEKETEDVYSKLSHSLQVEVARSLTRGLLTSVAAFQNTDERFLDLVSVILREAVISPDEYIFHANEVSHTLYIIAAGTVEICTAVDDEEQVDHTKNPGDLVGELSFFFGIRQNVSARSPASAACTLFTMLRADYSQVVKLFPDEDEKVTRAALGDSDSLGVDKGDNKSVATSFRETATDDIDRVRKVLELAKKKKHNERVVAMVAGAHKGSLEDVKRALQNSDLTVNDGDYDRRTSLHLAASEGHLELVKWLVVDCGADIKVRDRFGKTPVADAIRHEKDDVLAFLIQQGGKIDPEGLGSVLCDAAAINDLKMIKRLARTGKPHALARVGNGVDPNLADYDLRTGLHLAASNGHVEAVKYFLEHADINVNCADRYGGTPLEDAMRHDHVEVQRLLFNAGGKIGLTMNASMHLNDAAAKNELSVIQCFHRNGVSVNIKDYQDRTPLHLAASNGSLESASWLLHLPEIEVNAIDSLGDTPLDDAINHKREVIEVLLRSHGAVQADHPSLAGVHEKNELLRERRSKEKFHKKARVVVNASVEHQMVGILEAGMTQLQAACGELNATVLSVLRVLRSIAYLNIEADEATQLGIIAHKDDVSMETRMQELTRLKELVKEKSHHLLQVLTTGAFTDESRKRVPVLSMVAPGFKEAVVMARTHVADIQSLIDSLLDQRHNPEYQFEVLRRDLRARIRANRRGDRGPSRKILALMEQGEEDRGG